MSKSISVGEFMASAHTLPELILSGDLVRVDCGEPGAFIMLEEPEYQIMRDALEAIIQLGVDGKLPDGLRQFLN